MPDNAQQDQIRWAVSTLNERQKSYRKYLDYYSGAHKLMIDSDRLERVFRGFFKDFRLNLCMPVVDALADRLQISGFTSDERQAVEDASEIWKRNRMDRRAGQLHQMAISGGDTYALVWVDANQNPTIFPQKPTEVCVEYDPESPGTITRAAKLWKGTEGRHYLNLYYPDRIEKYQSEVRTGASSLAIQNFRERVVDGEAWPLLNTYGEVPIFHFANNADLGELGRSELTEAVPVQDALNKSVFDMLVANEYQAYPQRYALNIEIKKRVNPETGEEEVINPFKAGPERVWALAGGENTQMGQFDAADVEKMLSVKQGWSLDMAQVTQTPPHYFMLPSGLVSGESQKTAEQKLDAKVSDREISFGDTWAALMSLAVRMMRGSALDGLEVATEWKNTKPRNELEEWQIVGMKQDAGVPHEQTLLEQGYEQAQLEKWKREGTMGPEPAVSVPTLGPLNLNGGSTT